MKVHKLLFCVCGREERERVEAHGGKGGRHARE